MVMSVGDNRLFKVNTSYQECTVIQFDHELIQLRDGYFALSNGLIPCHIMRLNKF